MVIYFKFLPRTYRKEFSGISVHVRTREKSSEGIISCLYRHLDAECLHLLRHALDGIIARDAIDGDGLEAQVDERLIDGLFAQFRREVARELLHDRSHVEELPAVFCRRQTEIAVH